jgi:two-component system, NtrC family, response regulator PilR
MAKILVVDDEARILLLLQSLLKANGYEVVTANSGPLALEYFGKENPDVVVSDLRMVPMDGMTLFKEINRLRPQTPFLLLTAYASVETAVEATKAGVFDYMTKPFKVDEMLTTVRRAVEHAKNNSVVVTVNADTPLKYQFENLIATNPAMLDVCKKIERVAPTGATILINGESGTGKEVIARTLHKASPRKDKPWVAVNCASIPEHLMESEMFGHVKGAFTGAVADKDGLFEVANGGTLFLDEISSLPLALQGKLLRVLQEKELRRVGGTKNVPVDVRVIAASNTSLELLVQQKTFREDLYYRFAVITLDIPPLRDRPEDIIPLAKHFLQTEMKAAQIQTALTQEAEDLLVAYRWPGNVRELENAIKHAVTFLMEGEDITPDLLPPRVVREAKLNANQPRSAAQPSANNGADTANGSLKSFLKAKEKEYMEQILANSQGDKEKAAQTLQVSLATLYRKISD